MTLKKERANAMSLQNYLTNYFVPNPTFLPMMLNQKYPHRLFQNAYYTEDVRKNMVNDDTRWLVEHIFFLKDNDENLKNVAVQYWDLKNLDDGSIIFSCRDGKGREHYFEHGHTDKAKFKNISFVLYRNILHVRK